MIETRPPAPPWQDRPNPAAPNAALDLARELQAARWAQIAVVACAAVTVACLLGETGLQFSAHSNVVAALQHSSLTASQVGGLAHDASRGGLAVTGRVVTALIAIPFLIWVHRAATLASRLRWHARHSPGMAVGSWFIPVVNFWFPYQAICDLFPQLHQDRRKVKRWWTIVIIGFGWELLSLLATHNQPVNEAGWDGLWLEAAIPHVLLTWAWAASFLPVVRAVSKCHIDAISGVPFSVLIGAGRGRRTAVNWQAVTRGSGQPGGARRLT